MPSDASNAEFQSVLAPLMDRFLQEKRACGYAYHEPFRILHRLDDFLVQQGLETLELPRGLARNWLAKKPHESARTQQQRITVFRQFSKFLLTAGCPAYVPDATVAARKSIFVPRMLTEEELRKFFRAVDTLEAYSAVAVTAPHYARGFPAPVRLRVSCERSAEPAYSRR